jgi:hypothetical protein
MPPKAIVNLMKVITIAIEKVIPYARNPRQNSRAIAKVAASIKEFGWQQPIVVDHEMTVIVGHTRLEAARQLGLTEVPVHIADGLSLEQVKAYRIADNKTGELAEWDEPMLKLELQELVEMKYDLIQTGFELADVEVKLAYAPDENEAPAAHVYRHSPTTNHDKLGIGNQRVPITPGELARGLARIESYLEVHGSLYGFVASLLGMHIVDREVVI